MNSDLSNVTLEASIAFLYSFRHGNCVHQQADGSKTTGSSFWPLSPIIRSQWLSGTYVKHWCWTVGPANVWVTMISEKVGESTCGRPKFFQFIHDPMSHSETSSELVSWISMNATEMKVLFYPSFVAIFYIPYTSWSISWAISKGKWIKYERLTLHNFTYILCLSCIYYETDLRDSSLYHKNSWVISYI
jgi:hypothetical protein